jgi:hypothetical protein
MPTLGLGLGLSRGGLLSTGGGGGTPPVNAVAPAISAPYYVSGQIITTTDGTWSGDLPITFSYQWQSSADGLTGWTNVGTNANTYMIPTSAAQLLFYRCVVTGNNSFGSASANSNVAGGVDSEALAHFNRVTTDSGVMTYGLIGVDTYIKLTKFIYNITTLSTKFTALRQLDYLGYKAGSGSGLTAGRAVQRIYSALGVSGDYVQNTTTAQPALGAWNQRNFISVFGGNLNRVQSGNRANPNRTSITIIVECQDLRYGVNNSGFISHGNNWDIVVGTSGAFRFFRLRLADASSVDCNANIPNSNIGTPFNGFVRVQAQNSGSDLLVNFATSTDGITYTPMGTQVTAVGKANQIGSASAPLQVGGIQDGSTQVGNFFQAQVYDSTNALLFNCQPSTYNRTANQTQFTASTGEVYTLQTSTAATGLKAMIVDQTMIQSNGTTMGMQAASLSINTSVFTQYNVWRKYSNVITAGAYGMLNEFGSGTFLGQGISFIPNENVNTESLYTSSNGGLNGTSWQSTSTALKVSIFEGDINGSPYEQTLRTNDVTNTFNAIQAVGVNTTNIVATGQNLLARNNAASLWLNAIWVGDAMTNTTDTSTERANFYNLLADLTNII